MNEKRTYSYSQLDCYQRCHKKWYWIYIEDLTPKVKSIPLQVGSLMHAFTDAYTQGIMTVDHIQNIPQILSDMYPNNDADQTAAASYEISRLLNGYLNHWSGNEIEIVSPEVHLVWEGPKWNLYTRLDALAKDSAGNWRLERKTTSRFDSHFLNGMQKGLQSAIAHWIIQRVMSDMKIRGTIFDLIVKTKTPQYYRTPVMMPKWKTDLVETIVDSIDEDIQNERFYPSLECDKYGKECSHSILCRHDSQQNRETFFESRKEVKEREAKVLKCYFEQS